MINEQISKSHHYVSCIWDGGVDAPQSSLISHQVNVRGPTPAVGEGVVVSSPTQAALQQHAAGAKMVLNLEQRRKHISPMSHFASMLCCSLPQICQI